jgi:hypothetical protein
MPGDYPAMERGVEIASYVADTRHTRATPRLKVFEPAEMRVGLTTERVHLLDLSFGGALVHSVAPPAVGATVRIACAGTTRLARVVRRDGDRFGVQFMLPLTKDQLAAAMSR